MESSTGPDGASEASYESVASEGGYEPACDRGRDVLPRLISSSHCVEVFRRIQWADDGAHCVHAVGPSAGKAHGPSHSRKGNQQHKLRPMDALFGLPPRMLRFDGAIEAWLEEQTAPRDPSHVPRPYASLNDAATRQTAARADLSVLASGNRKATLWYFTLEFLQQLWATFLVSDDSGVKYWQEALQDRGCTIESTHVEAGKIHCPPSKNSKQRTQWLKAVFAALQASKWTPDGEARSLIAKRRLTHASMSVGDAVQIGSQLYMATPSGFNCLTEAHRILPQRHCNEEGLDEENNDSQSISTNSSEDSLSNATAGLNNGVKANGNPWAAEISSGNVKNGKKRRKGKNKGGVSLSESINDTQANAKAMPHAQKKGKGKGRGDGASENHNSDAPGRRGKKGKGKGDKAREIYDDEEQTNGHSAAHGASKGKGKGRGAVDSNDGYSEVQQGKGAKRKGRGKKKGDSQELDWEPAYPLDSGGRPDRRRLRAGWQAHREAMQRKT